MRTERGGTIGMLAVVAALAFAMMGSNGSCAQVAGPGYGQGQGYGQGPATQTFYQPRINGQRVDWCFHWANQCGQPAATAFCQRVGFNHATNFQKAPNIGAGSPTLVLGDGATCNQPGCDGFDTITCTRGGYAGPGPGPGPGPVRFSHEPNTNRAGMDYRRVDLGNPQPKQCKNLCRREPQCRAFTYVKPGIQHPTKAVCWLKSGVPGPSPSNCCVSGVKQ
ncbi:MAG: PAN domain-containing protein [Myxococcota bacterium]